MDIRSIAPHPAGNISLRQSDNAAVAAFPVNAVHPATERSFQRAEAVPEPRQEKSRVQISSQGKLRLALADIQAAGKALKEPAKTSSADQVRKSLQDFVGAYNAANNAANNSLSGTLADKGRALSGDNRIHQAGIDLNSVVTAGNIATELGKIGITANRDGSLKLDRQALDKMYQENPQGVTVTLANLARQAEGAVARQNDTGGNTINAINNRAREYAAQQNAQQTRIEASQNEVEQRANQNNRAFSLRGIEIYQRTISL